MTHSIHRAAVLSGMNERHWYGRIEQLGMSLGESLRRHAEMSPQCDAAPERRWLARQTHDVRTTALNAFSAGFAMSAAGLSPDECGTENRRAFARYLRESQRYITLYLL